MSQITVAKVEMQGEGEKQFLLVTAQDGAHYSVWAKGVKGLLVAGNTYEVEVKEKGDWKNITAAKLVEAPPQEPSKSYVSPQHKGNGAAPPTTDLWHRYLSWAELVAQARIMAWDTIPSDGAGPKAVQWDYYAERFRRALALICGSIREEMGREEVAEGLKIVFTKDTSALTSGGPQEGQQGASEAPPALVGGQKPSAGPGGKPLGSPEAARPALAKPGGSRPDYNAFWEKALALPQGYNPAEVFLILKVKGMASWVEQNHTLDEALEILRQHKKEG